MVVLIEKNVLGISQLFWKLLQLLLAIFSVLSGAKSRNISKIFDNESARGQRPEAAELMWALSNVSSPLPPKTVFGGSF